MPAYGIALILEVLDEEGFAHYRANVAATVEAGGGRYLAGTDQLESQAGSLRPYRIAIVEWPTWEHARAWFDGDEYRPLRELVARAARTEFLLVSGE